MKVINTNNVYVPIHHSRFWSERKGITKLLRIIIHPYNLHGNEMAGRNNIYATHYGHDDNSTCVILCDYITKSPPKHKFGFSKWRLRWFVLHDNKSKVDLTDGNGNVFREISLRYYENKKSYESGASPLGTIDLKFSNIRKVEENIHGYKMVIEILTVQHRPYYLCFSSHLLFDIWFNAMKELQNKVWAAVRNETFQKFKEEERRNTIASEAESEDSAYRTDSNASVKSYCDMNMSPQPQSKPPLSTSPSSPSPPMSPPLSVIGKFHKKHSKSHLSSSMDALNKIYAQNKHEQLSSFLTPPVPKRTISLERSAEQAETSEDGNSAVVASIDKERASTVPINFVPQNRYTDTDKNRSDLPLSPDSPLSPTQLNMWNMLQQQKEKNTKHRSASKEFHGPAFKF